MQFAGFDWDKGNSVKCHKHGVSAAEIEELFAGQFLTTPDARHSDHEARLKAFGITQKGRPLLVVFTIRHKNSGVFLRPISARYMHKKEFAYYEKETANPQNR